MKETLIEALKSSGSILLDYYNKPLETFEKESQSSVVTEADFESDRAITSIIRNRFPGHNLISEESGFIDNKSEYTWIIDPLDGTSNFASGIPWFGVLITLLRGMLPVIGGAYLPVQDLLYWAEESKGAFRNNEPVKIRNNPDLRNSLFAFSVDYTEDEPFLDHGMKIYKYIVRHSRNIRSTNSLIDFLYVAEGKFGGCINLFTKVWDIAGLGLIISEAGGVMTLLDGGKIEFNINNELSTQNFPVIAGSEAIAGSLKDIFSDKNQP
jgi:myo-inositol-1(or 4)-monophosphatase